MQRAESSSELPVHDLAEEAVMAAQGTASVSPLPGEAEAQEDEGETGSKRWTVGTLSYTKGALVLLFFWLLLGDFAWSMRDRSVGPASQWYLNHLEVPNLLFGLLISSFPALIGLILGPIISVKSDRHRGKWGRRIPFLLITTPMAAMGMVGIGVTPFIATWVHSHFPGESEMLISVLCFGVFWAAFEVATIIGQCVFGGLVNDVVPKELLGRFYGLFRAVSLIDGMIFNYWLMGKVPDYFSLILITIGIFYGTAFTFVCLKVKEGNYPPPPPKTDKEGWQGVIVNVRTYIKECYANTYYLWVFATATIGMLCFMPVNIFSIPFARSVGVDMDVFGKYMALTYFISLCLAYFLGWMADKFHPLRMIMGVLFLYSIVTVWGFLNASTAHSFLIAWVLHGVISGCFYTTVSSLGQRLFPHDRYAQFSSAGGILGAPINMALAPVVGTILDVSGNIYRLTFGMGSLLALVALASAFVVHGRFMKLGGPKNYVAPG